MLPLIAQDGGLRRRGMKAKDSGSSEEYFQVACKQLKELFWDSEIEEYDSMQHALVLFDFLFWIFNFETLNFRSELHSPENYFPHQNDDVTM